MLEKKGEKSIEVGALGIPMPFDNILTVRSLEEAHARCSFTDPYIGEDVGYLRVTRLSGRGPTMVVTPVGRMPLEAWPLVREPMRPSQTFEGMMEWAVHTRAWADAEWKGVHEWNESTEAILKPGERRTYGVQLTLSPSIRGIEATLAAENRPVAVSLPGYVVPTGALAWTPNREGRNGWRGYTVTGKAWGRARLTVTYADGVRQVVSYNVIKPAAQAVADLGRFLTT